MDTVCGHLRAPAETVLLRLQADTLAVVMVRSTPQRLEDDASVHMREGSLIVVGRPRGYCYVIAK
ncbi:MAG: hypothetical protein JWN15_736 [Firmicutes bacterium]|nr:hypothetical protein [Bacillota bacterium]